MFNFGISNVMTKIIGFLLIPVYTQYLSPADYGIVEMCATLLAFLIIFMRIGVPGAVNRFYFDFNNDRQSLNNYVTTIHRLLVVSSAVIGLIITVLLYFYSDSVLPGILYFPFIILTIINAAFSANSDLQKRLLQSKEKSKYVAKLNISLGIIGIGLALFFVVFQRLGAIGLILSQSVTTLIFFIQAQYYLRPYLKGSFDWSMLKDSLRYGAGILPHHLVTVLAPLISKGLLNYKGSLVALGVFSLASRFLQPLDLLYSTFVTSFGPVYFSLRNEENMEKIKSVYSAVWILAVIFFVTTVSIFPYLILLITPERFHQSAQLIPILAWGFLGRVLYYFFLVENYFDKNTSRVSMVTGVGLIVNLSVTLIAIDKYEVYAVASASALGFLSQAAAGFIISKKHFLNYIKPSQIVSGLIISLTVFVLVLNIPVDALFSRLIIVLVALGLLTLANLRSLKGIYSAL